MRKEALLPVTLVYKHNIAFYEGSHTGLWLPSHLTQDLIIHMKKLLLEMSIIHNFKESRFKVYFYNMFFMFSPSMSVHFDFGPFISVQWLCVCARAHVCKRQLVFVKSQLFSISWSLEWKSLCGSTSVCVLHFFTVLD